MSGRPDIGAIAQRLYGQVWGIYPPWYKSLHARFLQEVRIISSPRAQIDDDSEDFSDIDNGPQVVQRPASALAVIPIHGVIGKHLSLIETLFFGGCDLVEIDEMLEAAHDDESVGTVILDIRSPGGLVIGVPETAALISEIAQSKRVIAYSDYMNCSAAYWLACSATEIYCAPSAIMGNVGTISSNEDITKMLEMMGIKIDVFVSGEYKSIGYDGTSLSEKQRAFLTEEQLAWDARFKDAVRATRNISAEELQGQWYEGERALPRGFADGLVNSLDELVATLLGYEQLVTKGF